MEEGKARHTLGGYALQKSSTFSVATDFGMFWIHVFRTSVTRGHASVALVILALLQPKILAIERAQLPKKALSAETGLQAVPGAASSSCFRTTSDDSAPQLVQCNLGCPAF